jgi:hypothetical protein
MFLWLLDPSLLLTCLAAAERRQRWPVNVQVKKALATSTDESTLADELSASPPEQPKTQAVAISRCRLRNTRS